MRVLHAVHGPPWERIVAVRGCKAQAVKSRMNRARAKLEATLLGTAPFRGRTVALPPAHACRRDA